MTQKTSHSKDFEIRIRHNLARKYVYEFLQEHKPDQSTDFQQFYEKWRHKTPVTDKSHEVNLKVIQLLDKVNEYLSSKDNYSFTYAEIEGVLGTSFNVASSDSLHISERFDRDRLDIWGTAETRNDEIAGTFSENLVGSDPLWIKALDTAAKAARCSFPILITGETGTGKDLVAREIHANSRHAANKCVVVNCGALPDGLIESELFGYASGAFTGASERGKTGWLEKASGGTLILDEIGDLSPGAQAALLRALQNGEIQKVGGDILHLDFRLITVSNQPLEQLVERGTFRRDLYYRVAIINVDLPPLRDRVSDIPLFIDYFLEKYRRSNPDLSARSISTQAIQVMKGYHWPGNTRELENVIARSMVLCDGDIIEPEHLVFPFESISTRGKILEIFQRVENSGINLEFKVDWFKLARCLIENKDRLTSAEFAKAVGISDSTARRHLKALADCGLLEHVGKQRGSFYRLQDQE